MKNVVLYSFILSLCVGCAAFNGYKFSNDEFSAVFQSKPNRKDESFDENGNIILTFYETSIDEDSFWLHQYVSIARLSSDKCNLSGEEKINSALDLKRREENSNKYLSVFKSFKFKNGITKKVKFLEYETLNKMKISRTYHKQIYIDKECYIYSINVFGSNKEKVDNLFEEFSSSFVLK
ncbi:MAG: hypothetical protein OEX19_03210 [Gammaproteobacteria bacterium]|nr:hypothetical protein [Gammaproteobacteria bacterium]